MPKADTIFEGMLRIKMALFSAVLILMFSLSPARLAGEGQDLYGNIADYLNMIYGIDGNAGLTAFPVLNIPMGGRSESIIAFSAISNDITFLELNPAGSSMLQRSELAFFHNNWIADSKIEGIAYATRFGDIGIAAGARWLYMPFTEYNYYGERVSGGYYSEGVAILNASYNFFSSYYFSGVSIGINLKGAFRLMPDYTDNNDNILSGSGLSQSAVMAMADIGLLTRFDFLKGYSSREKNASAAIVARNLGPPALGDPLPTAVTAAFSYKPIRPLTFGFDFTLPLNLMDLSLSEMPYMSLGASVNVTEFLTMNAGFLYKAGSSRIAIGSTLVFNRIAIEVNYTLDLLTQLQPLNRVSLAVRLDLGDNGRQVMSDRVDELYLLGLEAFSRRNFTYARVCWEEALRLNPRYSPAMESLAILGEIEVLEERIDALYRLNF